VKAVVFDLDGTLTLPGALDLKRLRDITSVPPGEDIVPYLRRQHADDPAALQRAMRDIDEEERKAFNPPKVRAGVKECLQELQKRGLRLAILTRNSPCCVSDFMSFLGLEPGTFAQIITRESDMPNKPHPAPLLHCCTEWGLDPSQVVMVGDSVDDMRCGRAAGCGSIAMLSPSEGIGEPGGAAFAEADAKLAAEADWAVSCLTALEARLRLA